MVVNKGDYYILLLKMEILNCEHNPDEIDAELSFFICCYLSDLTLKQRALLLSLSSSDIEANKDNWEGLQDTPEIQAKIISYLGK